MATGDEFLDETTLYSAEIICQGRHAGGFIGRNGSSIEKLRNESGSTVKVSHFDQHEQRHGKKNDRLVQLSGNARALFLGLQGVANRFAAISADNVQFSRKQRENELPQGAHLPPQEDEWNKFQLTILVPAACVGRIVGSKGRKIKELSEQYGCKVNLSRDFFPQRSTHRRTQLQHHEVEGLAYTALKICQIVKRSNAEYPQYHPPPAPHGYNPHPHMPVHPPVSHSGYITTTHHGFPRPGGTPSSSNPYPQTHRPDYAAYPYASHYQHAAHPYTQPAPPPPPNPASAHPPPNYGGAPPFHGMPPSNPHFDKFAPY